MLVASRLYNYMLLCYRNGTITETNLDNAVTKEYITAAEKVQIMSG